MTILNRLPFCIERIEKMPTNTATPIVLVAGGEVYTSESDMYQSSLSQVSVLLKYQYF
jgi:hypothetical protein